jgi:hypothetical protein
MTSIRPIAAGFREGEAIVLARGPYQGTPGVFLRLREDPKWADVQESSEVIRSHPVAWIEHAAGPAAL